MAHRTAGVAFACLIAFGSACSTPTSPDDTSATSTASAATPPNSMTSALVDMTNAERRKAGAQALAPNSRLMQAAQIQAEQNASAGRLEHVSSGARYPRVEDRLAAVGYRWSTYGENIAYGQQTPSAVMQSWMGSSGHRGNILNPSFTEIGIGYARDASGRPYYAQVFARPAS